MNEEKGRAELFRLLEFATQDRFVYAHKWRVGDLVIWDNRCALHRRNALDPSTRRHMHRTQVQDDARPVAA